MIRSFMSKWMEADSSTMTPLSEKRTFCEAKSLVRVCHTRYAELGIPDIQGHIQEGDLALVADVDEIPRVETLKALKLDYLLR